MDLVKLKLPFENPSNFSACLSLFDHFVGLALKGECSKL